MHYLPSKVQYFPSTSELTCINYKYFGMRYLKSMFLALLFYNSGNLSNHS